MNINDIEKYECNLCLEKIIDNDRIICPHCNIEICEKCFQYSITMEIENPKCIYCKNIITLEFILSNNSTKWCENIFLDYFSNLLLENEKTKIIDTLPKFKIINEIKLLKNERKNLLTNIKIKNLVKKKDLTQNDYDNLINERNLKNIKITNKINELEKEININKIKKEKIIYIKKCPINNCKGYISTKYICELCNINICKSCMCVKNDDHICDRNDIECAELIKNDSKPCPKCFVPIFKINGCNQMFCTNCNTAFHWITLKIDNGLIHNQHYFDYLKNLRSSTELNEINNSCDNITLLYNKIHGYINNSNGYINNFLIHNYYISSLEFQNEVIEILRNKIKNNFENYRIEYLSNKISEKNWSKKILNDSIYNQAMYSYIEIFEMYIIVIQDIFRKLCFDINEISKLKLKNTKKIIINFFLNKFNHDDILKNHYDLYREMQKNNIKFSNYADIEILIQTHDTIKWDNYNYDEHTMLDNFIYIYIDNDNIIKLFNDTEDKCNYIKKHFKKCIKETYQTFGILLSEDVQYYLYNRW